MTREKSISTTTNRRSDTPIIQHPSVTKGKNTPGMRINPTTNDKERMTTTTSSPSVQTAQTNDFQFVKSALTQMTSMPTIIVERV